MMHVVNVDPVVKGLAVIYADTKNEVPETAEAVFEALEPNEYSRKLGAGLAAGTIIMTSAFDVACIRGDGLIQWKGDPAPTPPPMRVTLTFRVDNGTGYICYVDPDTGEAVRTSSSNHDKEIEVMTGSTVVCTNGSDVGVVGTFDTNCKYKQGKVMGGGGQSIHTVYIDNATPYIKQVFGE